MESQSVAIAALGLAGTMAAGFFALIKEQNKIHEKLSISIDKMADSSELVARATEQGNREAKERNGHLAELMIQSKDQTLDAILNIKEQRVEHQTVESETVLKQGRDK